MLPDESVNSAFSSSLKGASSGDGFHQASKSFFDLRMQVYDLLQYLELDAAVGNVAERPAREITRTFGTGQRHDFIPYPKRDPDATCLGRR